MRQAQERMLEALDVELEEKRTSELERKYAQKYKMVRFFGKCAANILKKGIFSVAMTTYQLNIDVINLLDVEPFKN